ncbi:PRELI domain-containing protein 1, mitochondrial-like [Saccostrea echinata]|uniref:PRELI domain-containing protein 1, mitochondrial-like n=1 Tax=Saccostrea echinata TaxID=191078 RepID=UPI002A7ED3E0|nr:PRELI domain-containing protein 1, mitochondrial-like [Saccostrea echinata]
MKYYFGSTAFSFNWDQVAIAFWHRYPNPFAKHVLSEDVISRRVVDQELHTKRLLKKTNKMTSLVQKFSRGESFTYIVEESIVDPIRKLITTYTRNIAMQNIVSVEEKVVYKQDPQNKNMVVCERKAWIYSPLRFGASGPVCTFVHKRFKKNAVKASNGFLYVLENMFSSRDQSQLINIPGQMYVSKEMMTEGAKKATEYAKKIKPLIPKS